jgi:hypothetical protein
MMGGLLAIARRGGRRLGGVLISREVQNVVVNVDVDVVVDVDGIGNVDVGELR